MSHRPPKYDIDGKWLVLKSDWSGRVGGIWITILAGFRWDGASIPWIGRKLLRLTPHDPRLALASLVHDYLYMTHILPRKTADEIYCQLSLAGGVKNYKARISHATLRFFGGWAWRKIKKV